MVTDGGGAAGDDDRDDDDGRFDDGDNDPPLPADGEPESGCTEAEFECADGKCVPRELACDGNHDCADRSDKPPMHQGCEGQTCDPIAEFTCKNLDCIPAAKAYERHGGLRRHVGRGTQEPAVLRCRLRGAGRPRTNASRSWSWLLAHVFAKRHHPLRSPGLWRALESVRAVRDRDEIRSLLHGTRAPLRPAPPGQLALLPT
ncbi:MAG: LDL receptor domain-containing protein [Myxococcota bacterium]